MTTKHIVQNHLHPFVSKPIISNRMKSSIKTHLSLGGGAFLPSGGSELLLQVVGFQGLADHLGLGGVGELNPVFGQMQVVHGVLLAGHTGGWAIDENLQTEDTIIRLVQLVWMSNIHESVL